MEAEVGLNKLENIASDGAQLEVPFDSSIFTTDTARARSLLASEEHIHFFHSKPARSNQKSAVRRFLEFFSFISEFKEEAMLDPVPAGKIIDLFFLARTGYLAVAGNFSSIIKRMIL